MVVRDHRPPADRERRPIAPVEGPHPGPEGGNLEGLDDVAFRPAIDVKGFTISFGGQEGVDDALALSEQVDL
jgi:hypothetical protein